MPDMDTFTLETADFAAQLMIADSTAMRAARIERFRDEAVRAVIYSLSLSVSQRRQWEETRTIPRKLTWRERCHALFGGEIDTTLKVSVYRNCPHIQADPQEAHIAFLAPDLTRGS